MSTHPLRLLAALSVIAAGCAQGGDKPAATTVDSAKAIAPAPVATQGVAIKTNPPAIAKVEEHSTPKAAPAKKSAPAKGAPPVTGVGKGKLAVTTTHKPGEQADVWEEQVDFAGDGVAEQADVGVDNYSHVAFAYAVEDEACKDGTVVKGAELMAVYGPNNTFKQPVGSGWYAAELAGGACGAAEPAIWGARFDANGNITAEGFATIDPKTNDLVIAVERDSTAAPAPAKKP
jgi:hypothetical protein